MGNAGKLLCALLSVLLGLVFVCSVRTLLLTYFRPAPPALCHKNESVGYISSEDAWPRFKKALQFPTVSRSPHDYNRKELKKFVAFIFESYPDVFKASFIESKIVNEYSLLITVKGKDPALTPYLLAAHMDVVPVVEEEWSVEAFAARENEDGSMVYARGAIDDKTRLIALLEVINFMVSREMRPRRGFFLAFGHDEEVSGEDGAVHIAAELRSMGIEELDFVLDEGLPILRNLISGFPKDVAGIGVSEKGFIHLNISVHAEGGHSSFPPSQTSIGILAAALARLEANPHKLVCDELTENFVKAISLDLQFPLNIITSNMWLFKSLVIRAFAAKSMTRALIQTTTAVTMFQGGIKHNVVPPSAWAIVNHRVHPSQTVDEVVKRDIAVINDDRVEVTVIPGAAESHPISPHDASKDRPYRIIRDSILQIHPNAVPAPLVLVANTDTKSYLSFSKHVFRHHPFILDAKTELFRIHGRDERMSKKNFESAMNFYYHLILNVDESKEDKPVHSPSDEL